MAARKHLRQVLRITSGPVTSSLSSLSHSFAQLSQLLNELNSSRLDFCPPTTPGGDPSSSTDADNNSFSVFSANASVSKSSLDQQIRDLSSSLKFLSQESEKMRQGITFLNSNLATLVNKAMADTLTTCQALEVARIEFDAERNHVLSLAASGSSHAQAVQQQQRLTSLESRYTSLKKDVGIKMQFLSQNRDKVLHKSLSLFQSLIQSFFWLVSPPVVGGGGSNSLSSYNNHHPPHNSNSSHESQSCSQLDSVLKAYSISSSIVRSHSMSSSGAAAGAGGGSRATGGGQHNNVTSSRR